MAQVSAQLKSLRMAPRKVRAVANLLKGKDVAVALNQLEYYVRRSSEPLKKLLNSAIANGENNLNMVKDNLYVKSIIVNEGIKLKRFRAKGFGRAAALQKKTSHIEIILDERQAGLRMEKKARIKREASAESVRETKAQGEKRPEIKREMGTKSNVMGNFGKKLFNRKSV